MPYPEHLRSKELAQPVVRESDDSMVRERMPGADSQALARSQVAAHEEAALILARLQAPVAPREAAQPFSVEEHSNAALQKIERHLDTLLGIFRRPAGPRPRGFWQEFKGVFQDLIQDPVDGFSEKIARYSIRWLENDLSLALDQPETQAEAVQILTRLMNDIDDDPTINGSYSHVARTSQGLCAMGTRVLSAHSAFWEESLRGCVSDEQALPFAKTVASAVRHGRQPAEALTLARSFFSTVREKVSQAEKNSSCEQLFGSYAEILRPLLVDGSVEEQRAAQEVWYKALLSGTDETTLRKIIESYRFSSKKDTERKRFILDSLVRQLGLDPARLYDADKVASEKKKKDKKASEREEQYRRQDNYVQNIAAAVMLERAAAGSAETLSRENGILTFARYPKKLLLRQLELTEADVPYGIVLNPREDWNGGFYGDDDIFQEFGENVEQEGMAVRIFECESVLDAAKKLIRLNRRYGVKQKISFAVVGGHGNTEKIVFGEKARRAIEKREIKGAAYEELRTFFIKEAVIVLNSCSTGGDNGVAEMLSRIGDLTVVGPGTPACLRSLSLKRQEERVGLEVEYRDGKEGKEIPARRYQSGKLSLDPRS